MSMIRSLPAILAPIDRRPIGQIEEEIQTELEFHIEMRALENAHAGMTPEAARAAAMHQFGDFERIRSDCRQVLLGERIMWQRIQGVVSVVLLVAVALLAIQVYLGQRANQAALADITTALQGLAEKEPTGAPPDTAAAPGAVAAAGSRAEQPVVVATVPESGATDVDPLTTSEVRVTFSKQMADKNWSWVEVAGYEFPQPLAKVHYLEDGRTCVMPVKLEPGRRYAIQFNSANHRNFKDAEGRPAEPYLLTFTTRD